MKKIVIFILSISIFLHNIALSKAYVEENKFFIIGKAKIGTFFMTSYEQAKEMEESFDNVIPFYHIKKGGYISDKLIGYGLLLTNNYKFEKLGDRLKKIDKKIIKKLGEYNKAYFKGDILVFIISLDNVDNKNVEEFLGKDYLVSYPTGTTLDSYEQSLKVYCKDDKISVIKIGCDFKNKDKYRNYLQSEIKTCENFYEMFEIRKEDGYRYYPEYMKEKMKYKKILKKNFGDKIKKLKNSGKKEELLKKIEELRKKVEKNLKYSKSKKEKIKILLDAFEEIMKK